MHPAGGWRFDNPDSLSWFPENAVISKNIRSANQIRRSYRKPNFTGIFGITSGLPVNYSACVAGQMGFT
jgi:hypothetical protein